MSSDRYLHGWGASLFGNWGASEEPPHVVPSPTNHVAGALAHLIAQYQDDPNMIALITALAGPWQSLEDAGYTLLQRNSLTDGFGQILDNWGDLIEFQRGGLADNTYRISLRGKVLANAATGNAEDARAVLDWLMQGTNPVHMRVDAPGVLVLRTYELTQAEGERFARLVQTAAPIGRRVILEWELPVLLGPAFGFEDDNSSVTWAEFQGDPTSAGLWAEAYDGR